jgi:molybdopterin adenylyltransferase
MKAVNLKRMFSSMPEAATAAVVTVSDTCARGERIDQSGPAVAEVLTQHGFRVTGRQTVPDVQAAIEQALTSLSSSARLVVTTGGTGIAPRDVTPEATRAVCDRLLDGISERMRSEGTKKTPFAALSRAVCGVRGRAVLLNLPGSPKGAVESLAAVIDLLPHALQLLDGDTSHGSQ